MVKLRYLLHIMILGAIGSLLSSGELSAQFQTPTLDGNVSAGEYGSHTDGRNQQTNGATTWYMTWDASNLYIAYTGSNINEGAVLYFDTDPIVPVNAGSDANGSNQGFFTYDRNQSQPPFRADFVVYFKSSYNEYRYADGAGYWGIQTAFTLPVASNGGSNTIEISIPWSVLTNGGPRPDNFNWFAYKTYEFGSFNNGVYHPVPTANPGCTCNSDPSRLYPAYYYNVLATANGSATAPFSTRSLTYSEDNSGPGGGFYLTGANLYDLTVNDNSADNGDNDPGNHVYDNNGPANRVLVEGSVNIAHDLYIGPGSALLPANNNPSDVLATVTFTGQSGSLYNFGRIDANPEASGPNDWDRRRLDFVFDGTTTLRATDIFKERYRFANVTVNAGDTLLGPATDSASIEFQWGVFNNNGVVDFGGDNGGILDFGTRGDWPQTNDYFLNSSAGTGTWHLHDILIGRNSSHLQPVNGGGVVRLELLGDFENYDEFTGKSGSGQIDLVMAGRERQFIRGNTTETNNAATQFHHLEIANADNLPGQFNNASDVWFESFGGGTIDYFLTGELTLTSGDLVTRHRTTNVIHQFTLRDSATVNALGARSNTLTGASCMVDGPLRYEVENALPVNLGFPVGKTAPVGVVSFGDFRPIGLQVDLDAATRTTFVAEMFLADRSTFYTWPVPIPEAILWITQQRYWNVTQVGGGANLQAALIALSYDTLELHDGVNAPSGLRIVKDDGAGNWVNITPGGPGGTAVGTGTITSQPFSSFSDFTLASVVLGQPLPVTLGDFTARRREDHTALRWTTVQEINVRHFEVEKSRDQARWHSIGQVKAVGNSNALQNYSWNDPEWEPGVPAYYYRLKTEDMDGQTRYSEVREVREDALENGLLVYPNPSSGAFWVDVPRAGQVHISDLTGRQLFGHSYTDGLHYLSPELPAGVYLLEFWDGRGQREHEKIWVR